MRTIVFGGGCFWGVQAYFKQIEGVVFTEVGYANGKSVDPSYREVCDGSGHTEAVMVTYDTELITTKRLIDLFFDIIDPTLLNQQGNDIGIQYRTGIYYEHGNQMSIAEKELAKLEEKYNEKIHVELEPLVNFYRAEDEHQDYLDKNPNGYCHIPKAKLETYIPA